MEAARLGLHLFNCAWSIYVLSLMEGEAAAQPSRGHLLVHPRVGAWVGRGDTVGRSCCLWGCSSLSSLGQGRLGLAGVGCGGSVLLGTRAGVRCLSHSPHGG